MKLAVAMEMFPRSSQTVLDEYVLGEKEMTEEAFLRASRWFEVWRYDWRFFRPIFTLCRHWKIPVYGINLEREIVSTVFNSGNTDSLSAEQKKEIAKNRDLSLDGYLERLRPVSYTHLTLPTNREV